MIYCITCKIYILCSSECHKTIIVARIIFLLFYNPHKFIVTISVRNP